MSIKLFSFWDIRMDANASANRQDAQNMIMFFQFSNLQVNDVLQLNIVATGKPEIDIDDGSNKKEC